MIRMLGFLIRMLPSFSHRRGSGFSCVGDLLFTNYKFQMSYWPSWYGWSTRVLLFWKPGLSFVVSADQSEYKLAQSEKQKQSKISRWINLNTNNRQARTSSISIIHRQFCLTFWYSIAYPSMVWKNRWEERPHEGTGFIVSCLPEIDTSSVFM